MIDLNQLTLIYGICSKHDDVSDKFLILKICYVQNLKWG